MTGVQTCALPICFPVTIMYIVDDLSWKGDKNYLMKHGDSRLEIYDQEGFPYKIYKVDI